MSPRPRTRVPFVQMATLRPIMVSSRASDGSSAIAGACPRHPRGVDVTHVLHRPDRVGRFDHELPALVLEECPVARPQDLDALQLAKHTDDPLGLIPIIDLQRDLAYRSFAADVYRRHVPDQTVSFRYRPGDLGQLPRAVRHLDAIRVIERQCKPPDVPAVRSYVNPTFYNPVPGFYMRPQPAATLWEPITRLQRRLRSR